MSMNLFKAAAKAVNGKNGNYHSDLPEQPVVLHHLRLDQDQEVTDRLLEKYMETHPTAYVDPTLGQWGAIAYYPQKEAEMKSAD